MEEVLGQVVTMLLIASFTVCAVLELRRPRVTQTTADRLADVKHGQRASLSGFAGTLHGLVMSPVGGHRCIAYQVNAMEPFRWRGRQHIERRDCVPFLLVDGETSVRVEGPFYVILVRDYRVASGNDVQVRVAAIIHGDRSRGPIEACAIGDYEYSEALVRPGDRVFVEGFISLDVDSTGPRASLRGPPMRYRLFGSAKHPTVVWFPAHLWPPMPDGP